MSYVYMSYLQHKGLSSSVLHWQHFMLSYHGSLLDSSLSRHWYVVDYLIFWNHFTIYGNAGPYLFLSLLILAGDIVEVFSCGRISESYTSVPNRGKKREKNIVPTMPTAYLTNI
jgi:hypothetical protein